MKRIWLAGAALLALAALVPAAQAQRVNFTYTGSLVTYTVPVTGLYQITAFGAQGGSSVYRGGIRSGPGGLGAKIGGDFTLTAGEILHIAVGAAGTDTGVGGGGGSFVVGPDNMPLVIAGGGGGGGGNPFMAIPGGGGLTGPDGSGTIINGVSNAGTGGNGGGGVFGGGGGGGGFFSAGGGSSSAGGSTGGGGYPELTGGSSGGGFGGGGGGTPSGPGGSGGGGGYSGGGGGEAGDAIHGAGGGGGSFDAGTNQILVADLQSGNGEVVISAIFAGTPGQPNCHGEVVSALAQQYGSLPAAAAALGYSSVQVLQNAIAEYCAG